MDKRVEQPPVQLIAGLGNPGPEHQMDRHNVGVWLVDLLARQYNVALNFEKKFEGHVGKIKLKSREVWLFIPTTYMNNSGKAVQALMHFYKIPVESVLVVHDELDFPAGTIRLKQNGGHGGHNGLRDILEKTGGSNFLRMRIGIGHPGVKALVHNYVLSKPSMQDQTLIMEAIVRGIDILPDLIEGKFEKAVLQLHSE